ncbi:MAG: hypothetical protein NT030_02205 [Candidatus Saganbacteria bacterium]|nr:hypothetical protein [Candidatus Saganbacteria bacterium]
MKIENEKKYLPPHLGHDFKIIFSLGCHETIKDAEHFKGVISAHNPDFFIFEIGDGTYHKTMAPRYMRMEKEETEGIKLKFDIGTSATNNPFYQEIGKIIESSQREYKMRAVEYLPINEVLEGHKLSREYASGGRVSLDYKNPEPGLRNTFIQHKGMHQGSAIRERRIIENIVELLESFDLYYPKIAEKKDISIVIHYGTTHFPMTNALERKTGKENISIIEVPQPSIISHLKTMKEFGLREDRTYEVPCDRWVESKIFLDLYFRAASLPGLMPDDLLSNLLRFTFIKRATFDTIFEKIRIGVDANYIFKTELKEIIKMVGKPLKAILKEDHPEYSDFIDKIEEPI